MIGEAEIVLLETVRDHIRALLGVESTACDLEPDESVPAIAGNEYIAVMPNGVTAGPRHNTSGGVIDVLFGFRVVVFHRVTSLPRDRRRNAYIDRARGLNVRVDEIFKVVDFRNGLINEATTALNVVGSPKGEFVECARFASMDARPAIVTFDAYDAARPNMEHPADPAVGIKRGINFGNCRFIAGRS